MKNDIIDFLTGELSLDKFVLLLKDVTKDDLSSIEDICNGIEENILKVKSITSLITHLWSR